VISRHASHLASSPDQPSPACRPNKESTAYAGADEKEGEGSDRKQKKKKKRRPKDEGSWEHPGLQEAQEERPASADGLYQRVGPCRDKAVGGAGEGSWEEQIGKSGGRGRRGKSRKKLPEEWAVMAEPLVPSTTAGSHVQAEMLVKLGVATHSLPVPEPSFRGVEHVLSTRSQEFYPEEEVLPDPLDQDLFSITASSVTQLAQSSELKATAAPFTMPAVSVTLGSFPISPGPAHSFSATHHEQSDLAFCDVVDNGLFYHGSMSMESYTPDVHLADTSAFSPGSQPSPDQCAKMEMPAVPLSPSDSSWLLSDAQLSASSDSFDLGDLPATLGCSLPAGLVLHSTGPPPLRSPRTTPQDCHPRPRECQETKLSRKCRSSSSSSSSPLKSPTFNVLPQDSPGLTPPTSSLASLASYLNPAAKPFFPSLNEPMEATTVVLSIAPVIEGWLAICYQSEKSRKQF